MKAFYVLRRANDGQCQIFDYATHQPIIEPGFDFLHAAVEWLDSHRRFSGDYEMVELAEGRFAGGVVG